ncbi:zinc-binding alcohol dehydrogenase family protein [soil metagenome]
MKAAVVSEFGRPPRYGEWPDPVAHSDHEQVVEVLAAGLHPRVRSQAGGSHYTSTDELPLVPGIDCVGRAADGSLIYFVLPDVTLGSMAERTVVDVRRSIPLPADADVARLAAAMNPAMSSWVALKKRVAFEPGQSVLVLGATGSAGQLAIQVARHLGAGEVIAAGRGRARLDALGADRAIDLEAGDISLAGNVDIVLDYLWGPPAEAAIMPLLHGRDDGGRLLSWVQIGAVAGPTVALPSEALRQANIHFLGSGQGSVSAVGILETLPSLVEQVGSFSIDVVSKPLAEVESVWPERAGTERVVLVP